MKTKHTSGPWVFRKEILCQATGNYLHLGKWAESPGLKDAGESNKDLIAAAPDLLEALVDLIPLVAVEYPAQADTWLANARAAIAKAKGEPE